MLSGRTVYLRTGSGKAKLDSSYLDRKDEFTFDMQQLNGLQTYITTNVDAESLRDFARWVLDVSAKDEPYQGQEDNGTEKDCGEAIPEKLFHETLVVVSTAAAGVEYDAESRAQIAALARRVLGEHQALIDKHWEKKA